VNAPAALLLFVLAQPAAPGTTPTPAPDVGAAAESLPGFVASLEVVQGERWERVALFDDGTIARAVRTGDASAEVQRKRISSEEKALLSKVIGEALGAGEMSRGAPVLLVDQSRRRLTIEIARPEGGAARFEFGDLSQLSLKLGRARGALEDLSDRFQNPRANEKAASWNPALAKEGDRLKRRQDGRLFRIVRDDALSPFMEMEEDGRRLERMKVSRRELPKFFEEPLTETAEPPR
jgi:hypothetical protein